MKKLVKKNNSLKKAIAAFSVLGVVAASLGVLSLSRMAVQDKTSTEGQAYDSFDDCVHDEAFRGSDYCNKYISDKEKDERSGQSGTTTVKSNIPTPDLALMNCKEYKLTNVVIRGNVSWVRDVPMDATGKELWGQAQGYWANVDFNKTPNVIPGSGAIQSYDASIDVATSQFRQYFARGGKMYYKSARTDRGLIDWNYEAQQYWHDMKLCTNDNNKTDCPAISNVTAYGTVIATVISGSDQNQYNREYVKVDGKSYELLFNSKFTNSKWLSSNYSDSSFKLQTDLRANPGALPGSGDITAQGDYINPKLNILRKDWIRGNVRYKQDVPIINGVQDTSKAGPIVEVQNLNTNPSALPGSGEVQALASYVNCKSL